MDINRSTGQIIVDVIQSIIQSIRDILTTRVGSRLLRPTYGSLVLALLDQPMNRLGHLRLMAATADAIAKWEPRASLTRVLVDVSFQGKVRLDLWLTLNSAANDNPSTSDFSASISLEAA